MIMSSGSCPPAGRRSGTSTYTGVDVLQVTTHDSARFGLPRVVGTHVSVTATGDVAVTSDVLQAYRLPDAGDRARVALVVPPELQGPDGRTDAQHGRIDVAVAAGRELEIVEITGVGAHAVQHARTQWLIDVRLAQDAVLVWPTLPIVVAEGADVLRLTHVDLAPGARVVLRETLVLSRAGRTGGRIRSTIRARLDGSPLLADTFVVEPSAPLASALHPALATVADGAVPGPRPPADEVRLDTLLVLGARLEHPEALQLDQEGSVLRGPAARVHDTDLAVALPRPRR